MACMSKVASHKTLGDTPAFIYAWQQLFFMFSHELWMAQRLHENGASSCMASRPSRNRVAGPCTCATSAASKHHVRTRRAFARFWEVAKELSSKLLQEWGPCAAQSYRCQSAEREYRWKISGAQQILRSAGPQGQLCCCSARLTPLWEQSEAAFLSNSCARTEVSRSLLWTRPWYCCSR